MYADTFFQAMHHKIGNCAEALKDEEFELIHFINSEIAQVCILIVQVGLGIEVGVFFRLRDRLVRIGCVFLAFPKRKGK